MKRLTDILAGVTGDISVVRPVALDAVVADVQLDSRCVTTGAVFVALARAAGERAAHIAQARAAGAIAVIGPPGSDADIMVADSAAAAAAVACAFYEYPARDLTVVAITGTNGKSSITHTLGGVLRTLGRRWGDRHDRHHAGRGACGCQAAHADHSGVGRSAVPSALVRRQPSHAGGDGGVLGRAG